MSRMTVACKLLVLGVLWFHVLGNPLQNDKDVKISPSTQSEEKKFFVDKSKKVTWKEASAECHSRNMGLATINRLREQTEVEASIKKARKPGQQTGGYWTSGSVKDDGVTLFWNTTGHDVSYTNWAANEPRVFGEFRCLLVNGGSRKWMFNNCSALEYFICESH